MIATPAPIDQRVARDQRLPPTRVVLFAVLASGIDNYVVPPMLLAIAASFGLSLGATATVVAAYVFAYGTMQLAWGYVSGRLGRLAAVRIGLGAGAVATLGAALAHDFTLLVVLRAIAGASFAAVSPATITYIGDHVPLDRRARALSDLTAVYAAGVALGIVLGALASDLASWRVGFLVSAVVAALALTAQLRYGRDRVVEPRTLGEFGASVARVVEARWPRTVALLALLEGAALFGFLTFFPAALEDAGLSRRTAGLVVALYGVAILVASRPASRLAARWPRERAMAVGVLLGALALLLAALSHEPASMGAAAVLLAVGFALVHPLLQSWATAVMPAERPTAVGLFATGLFVGTAITTQAAAPFLERIGYGGTFAVGAALATLLAAVLLVSWTRYERATAGP